MMRDVHSRRLLERNGRHIVLAMLDLILPTYTFALTFSQKLVHDVPDEQMCAQPVPDRVMNHAAWVIGHLAWANDNALRTLGREPSLGEPWKAMFAMGSKPLPDRAAYPTKVELLRVFTDAHARLLDAVREATPEMLAAPAPDRMRARFPTVATMLAGLMTSHYANHNGQLSAWRRAMGFPSVF
jgi:hypothetical protein